MTVAMMVGAHNTIDVTVECQVHMGGCVGFFRKGGCRYLQNTEGSVAGMELGRPVVFHANEVVEIPSNDEADTMAELPVSPQELAVV